MGRGGGALENIDICRSPSIHSWLYVWVHMYIEIYRWMHILYIYDIYIYALNIHIFCMSVCLYHFSNRPDSPITVCSSLVKLRAKMRGPTWYNTWLVWIHVEHISTVGMLQVDCWPGPMGRTETWWFWDLSKSRWWFQLKYFLEFLPWSLGLNGIQFDLTNIFQLGWVETTNLSKSYDQ